MPSARLGSPNRFTPKKETAAKSAEQYCTSSRSRRNTAPGDRGLLRSPCHAQATAAGVAVGRTHLWIQVELVDGAHVGEQLWPRPGRVMIASRTTTFQQLATGIDDAFGRWDRAHLHEFALADGTSISPAAYWDGDEPEGSLDGSKTRLGRLRLGEQFAYVFDLGDNWQHLCTVADKLVDPVDTLGIVPDVARPLPAWGWGSIPDQYGRNWNGDDGSTPMPPAPDGLTDLPPILPWWGPQPRRAPAPPPEPPENGIRYRDLIN